MPRHPIEATLREAVYGGRAPSAEDLDDLGLPPEVREKVTAAASEALELWRSGERGRANELAMVRAREIVADLPPRLRDPAYGRRDPLRDVTDPDELAAAIPPLY